MKIKVQFSPGTKRKTEAPPPIRIPRIAKLMALAIHFDQLILEGKVKDQAEIAELGHVSRPRLTQIMNLLALAPNIQEQILTEPAPITERQLRPLAAISCWKEQYRLWSLLNSA